MDEDYQLASARAAEESARRRGDRDAEALCTSMVNELVAKSLGARP